MVVGDVTTGTDLLVIGGGPGGYTAAIRAAQLDLDVTLVEADGYGGTCLNHGCIPSKAYITATEISHRAGSAEAMGIHADPAVDLSGLRGWKDEVVDQLTTGVERLCKGNDVNLVEGRAEFVNDGRARVVHDGDGQGSESIEFEHVVIATGSRPQSIPGFSFDGEAILSSADAFALAEVPDRLCIVGAGYIGMELSTVFAKLGADVTVVEMLADPLPGIPDDVSRIVRKRAETLGVEFTFGRVAKEWRAVDDGVRLTTEASSAASTPDPANSEAESSDTEPTEIEADRLLIAIGREPVTETLNLDAIGLEPDSDGFLRTDETARTSHDDVFAVGDVAGEPMLAHKAMKEGQVAAEVVAGEPAALDYQAVPAAVFTNPEIGIVGLTESEAEAAGFDPITGQMSFQASGRALTMGETDGFVRVVADAETEFVLGGLIVGPDASELVAELGLAIEMGATLEDVTATIHTHPTLAEAVMEAAANARGTAVHTLNR